MRLDPLHCIQNRLTIPDQHHHATSYPILAHTRAACEPVGSLRRTPCFRKENRCRSRKARKDEGGVVRSTPHRDRPKPDAEMQRLCAAKSAGGSREGDTPGPIPNPAVKPLSADGTAASGRGRVGHRRLLYRTPHPLHSGVGRLHFRSPRWNASPCDIVKRHVSRHPARWQSTYQEVTPCDT